MGIKHADTDDIGKEEDDPLFLLLIILLILSIIIGIGTIGYRIFGNMEWIDAFHNGSMVLTSTSLVTMVNTYHGKIFSALYNLFTGVFVILIIGVILRRALDQTDITSNSTNEMTSFEDVWRKRCSGDKCRNKHNT